MNKKGTLGVAVVIALIIFLMGIPVINLLKPDVDIARGSTGLDCTNSSISDGAKLTCLGIDTVIPYFILIVLSVAGGLVGSKFL